MADAVDVQVLHSGPRHIGVRICNLSDGTGETAVKKIDKSSLAGFDGVEPTTLSLERISWAITGMSVTVAFDHTTDDVIAQLGEGSGEHDYTKYGGALQDPASAGDTGDVVVTTTGHSAGDTYDILMLFRLDK